MCQFHLLVEVVERVRGPHDHLHSCLAGQLLDGRISLLPEGLRVALKRQPVDVPLLWEGG